MPEPKFVLKCELPTAVPAVPMFKLAGMFAKARNKPFFTFRQQWYELHMYCLAMGGLHKFASGLN